jgi:hypothetical protein
MKYLPYDMDNTFGVQWGFSNINNRNIYNWGDKNKSAAPLTYALLAHTEFQRIFEGYLYGGIEDFFNPKHMYPIIDSLSKRLDPWIKEDKHFAGIWDSDYGFSYEDWKKSIVQGLGNHATYGIKPYISDRGESAKQQFKFSHGVDPNSNISCALYPNPASTYLIIDDKSIGNISKIRVFDLIGKQMNINILEENKLDVTSLKDGIYFLMLENRFVGRFEMKR